MGIEIERKFLVTGSTWRTASPRRLAQGYLNLDVHRTVRVRLDGEHAFLTVKGITTGAVRSEFEYAIPYQDAEQLLALCTAALVEKYRHILAFEGMRWEIDEFTGENAGLVVAEIELESQHQQFAAPPWLGVEVTHDPRYFNSNLAQHPWRTWRDRSNA